MREIYMRTALILSISIFSMLIVSNAHASETIRYIYDAKGRVIRVERAGSINNGIVTVHQYDRANNRRRVIITGSSNLPPP